MKKYQLLLLIILCCSGLVGCRSIPFKETVLVPLHIEDPENCSCAFNQQTPDSFTLLNSLVFNYYWHLFPVWVFAK